MQRRKYTREEKIEYFKRMVAKYKWRLFNAETRLMYLQSDEYQDWDSDLQKDLDRINAHIKKEPRE